MYYVRCPNCLTVYAVDDHVKLIPLPPDQRAWVEAECANVIQEDGVEPRYHGNADLDCDLRLPGIFRANLVRLFQGYRGKPADRATILDMATRVAGLISEYASTEVSMALAQVFVAQPIRDGLRAMFTRDNIGITIHNPGGKP